MFSNVQGSQSEPKLMKEEVCSRARILSCDKLVGVRLRLEGDKERVVGVIGSVVGVRLRELGDRERLVGGRAMVEGARGRLVGVRLRLVGVRQAEKESPVGVKDWPSMGGFSSSVASMSGGRTPR